MNRAALSIVALCACCSDAPERAAHALLDAGCLESVTQLGGTYFPLLCAHGSIASLHSTSRHDLLICRCPGDAGVGAP